MNTTHHFHTRCFLRHNTALTLITLSFALLLSSSIHAAQRRDSLTDIESDRVRDAQEIDKRVDVFIKIIERRLAMLTDAANAPASKQAQKDLEKWGELRAGTQSELIGDIVGVLNSAIDNIDDASSREPQKKLLPKALQKLQTATNRFVPQLTALRGQTQDADVRRLIDESMELAASINEAKVSAAPSTNEPKKN